MNKYTLGGLTALALTSVSSIASAAAPDVTATVTAIGEAAAPIAAIGGAVLAILVATKVYKWVRRAM